MIKIPSTNTNTLIPDTLFDMRKKILLLIFACMLAQMSVGQLLTSGQNVKISEVAISVGSDSLYGTIYAPLNVERPAMVLIIPGSGPTDRNGNSQMGLQPNYLKMLAQGLADHGIASLRYDKRGVGKSAKALKAESEIRFRHGIDDAETWLEFLLHTHKYSSVTVLGHSEGAAIGLFLCQKAQKYISLAGIAYPADQILRKQLEPQPQYIKALAFPILDSLTLGKTVKKIDPSLNVLFRPSLQPYLISWFAVDPSKEIAAVKIPILVLQGTKDLQVGIDNAERLAKASGTVPVLIENMNHILKLIPGDNQENIASYSNPNLNISTKLVTEIVQFIKAK